MERSETGVIPRTSWLRSDQGKRGRGVGEGIVEMEGRERGLCKGMEIIGSLRKGTFFTLTVVFSYSNINRPSNRTISRSILPTQLA